MATSVRRAVAVDIAERTVGSPMAPTDARHALEPGLSAVSVRVWPTRRTRRRVFCLGAVSQCRAWTEWTHGGRDWVLGDERRRGGFRACMEERDGEAGGGYVGLGVGGWVVSTVGSSDGERVCQDWAV